MRYSLLCGIAASALCLAAGAANGQSSTYISGHSGKRSWSMTITRVPLMSNSATIIRVPRLSEADQAVADERERLWEIRCEPRIRVDDLGVSRYVYKAKGCDLGKWE